jgi:hypothetical protein
MIASVRYHVSQHFLAGHAPVSTIRKREIDHLFKVFWTDLRQVVQITLIGFFDARRQIGQRRRFFGPARLIGVAFPLKVGGENPMNDMGVFEDPQRRLQVFRMLLPSRLLKKSVALADEA